MDQASIALGGIIKLDCATLEFEQIEVAFGDYCIVIMDSAKERTLAASKYNERVAEIAAILNRLAEKYQLVALCDLPPDQLDIAIALLEDEVLARRLRHVVTENERVVASAKLLQASELVEFGELLNASHQSLSQDYEVTGRELDYLVGLSQEQPGVLGARMTGAGFGGCCIALMHQNVIADHNKTVAAAYEKATGLKANFIVAKSSSRVGLL